MQLSLPDIVMIGQGDECSSEDEEEYYERMERYKQPTSKKPETVNLLNDKEVKLSVKVSLVVDHFNYTAPKYNAIKILRIGLLLYKL